MSDLVKRLRFVAQDIEDNMRFENADTRNEIALLREAAEALSRLDITLTLFEASLLVSQIRKAMTGQGFSLEHIGKLHEITGRMADEIKAQIGDVK